MRTRIDDAEHSDNAPQWIGCVVRDTSFHTWHKSWNGRTGLESDNSRIEDRQRRDIRSSSRDSRSFDGCSSRSTAEAAMHSGVRNRARIHEKSLEWKNVYLVFALRQHSSTCTLCSRRRKHRLSQPASVGRKKHRASHTLFGHRMVLEIVGQVSS